MTRCARNLARCWNIFVMSWAEPSSFINQLINKKEGGIAAFLFNR